MGRTKTLPKIISPILAIIFLILIAEFHFSASASSKTPDTTGYTAVSSGTVSWQMIKDNPNTYYWIDADGYLCALTATQSGSNYYVTLYRPEKGSELRYLRQDKSDDSGSKHEWSSASAKYTGGTLYMKATVQTYTVTWMNQDGTQVLETDTGVSSGSKPSYDGNTPTKNSTAQYNYSFTGWSTSKNTANGTQAANLPTVTANTTYYAAFSEATRTYTISFQNADGSTLTTRSIAYGASPTKPATDPTKTDTVYYSYKFLGWASSPDVTANSGTFYTGTLPKIYGQTTFYPVFEETKKDYDFSVQDITLYLSDGHFEGASPNITEYDAKLKKGYAYLLYTVNGESFDSYDDMAYRFVLESDNESITEQGDKTLANGTPKSDFWLYVYNTPGTATVTAKLYVEREYVGLEPLAETTFTVTVVPASYTVTYLNGDGNELDHETVEHGQMPKGTDKIPTKASTDKFVFIFDGWEPELGTITGDTTYKPRFTEKVRTYEIAFIGEDGTPISSSEVAYGETPTAPEAPAKASNAEYTYTFNGWSPAITEVTGPATYTATYSSTKNKYTITFEDETGNVLQSSDIEYGETPVYKGETPTKIDTTGQNKYRFTGWSPAITSVTTATTYKTTFEIADTGYHIIVEDWTGEKATTSIHETEYYFGNTPFEVSAPLACVVTLHTADGSIIEKDQTQNYERLYGTKTSEDTYTYQVNVTNGDIYVAIAYVGDLNLDGKINLKDANLMTQALTGRFTTNSFTQLVGDVNKDKKVNLKDANSSTQVLTGRITYDWDTSE